MRFNISYVMYLSLFMIYIVSAEFLNEESLCETEKDKRIETVHGKTYHYCCINCRKMYQGDMELNLGTASCCSDDKKEAESRRLVPAVSSQYILWENGAVPYEIADNMPQDMLPFIQSAIDEYNTKTVIKLFKRTTEDNYVYFYWDGKRNSSPLGVNGGRNFIRLGRKQSFVVLHELGHSLGWYHTFSREDRDLYLKINWENMKESRKYVFADKNTVADDCLKFDYRSIMMYNSTAVSSNGDHTQIVMEAINPIGAEIGPIKNAPMAHLTQLDIKCMNGFYSRCRVSLYEDDHFQGQVYTPLGLGEYTLKSQYSQNEYKPFSDDQIESLKVDAAADTLCIIDLAQDPDFKGWLATITVDNTNNEYRKTFDYNLDAIKAISPQFEANQMSSLRVSYKSSCSVTFFTEKNYGGKQTAYDIGKYTSEHLKVLDWSDAISSYKINALRLEECKLELFEKGDLTGNIHERMVSGGDNINGKILSVPALLTSARCNAYLKGDEIDIKKDNKVGTLTLDKYLEIEFDIEIKSKCTNSECVALTIGGNSFYADIFIDRSKEWNVYIEDGTDYKWIETKIPSEPGSYWYHIYMTISGTQLTFRVDAVQKVFTVESYLTKVVGNADIYIGSPYYSTISGKMKNVCIRTSQDSSPHLNQVLSFQLTVTPTPDPYTKLPLTSNVCNAYLKADEMDVTKGNKVGTLTVSNFLEIEYDIKITSACKIATVSAPDSDHVSYCNFLQIGDESTKQRYPQILKPYWESDRWDIRLSRDSDVNGGQQKIGGNDVPRSWSGDGWLHFYIAINDNELLVKIEDKEFKFNGDYKRSYVGNNANIWIGADEFVSTFSAKMRNICIRTSDTAFYSDSENEPKYFEFDDNFNINHNGNEFEVISIAVIAPLLTVFIIGAVFFWCLMKRKQKYEKLIFNQDSTESDDENAVV